MSERPTPRTLTFGTRRVQLVLQECQVCYALLDPERLDAHEATHGVPLRRRTS